MYYILTQLIPWFGCGLRLGWGRPPARECACGRRPCFPQACGYRERPSPPRQPGTALTSPTLHVCGCARPSRACFGHRIVKADHIATLCRTLSPAITQSPWNTTYSYADERKVLCGNQVLSCCMIRKSLTRNQCTVYVIQTGHAQERTVCAHAGLAAGPTALARRSLLASRNQRLHTSDTSLMSWYHLSKNQQRVSLRAKEGRAQQRCAGKQGQQVADAGEAWR